MVWLHSSRIRASSLLLATIVVTPTPDPPQRLTIKTVQTDIADENSTTSIIRNGSTHPHTHFCTHKSHVGRYLVDRAGRNAIKRNHENTSGSALVPPYREGIVASGGYRVMLGDRLG